MVGDPKFFLYDLCDALQRPPFGLGSIPEQLSQLSLLRER